MNKNTIDFVKLEAEAGQVLVALIYYYRARKDLENIKNTDLLSKESKEEIQETLKFERDARYEIYANMREKMEEKYGFYIVDDIMSKAFRDWLVIERKEIGERFTRNFQLKKLGCFGCANYVDGGCRIFGTPPDVLFAYCLENTNL